MTRLFGVSSFGTPVSATDLSGDSYALRFAGGYTAIAGTMVTAHVTISIAAAAGHKARIYVYSGGAPGATFVAMSAEFLIDSTGDKTAAISGAISAGTYSLEVQGDAGSGTAWGTMIQSGSASNLGRQNTPANFPYGAAPGALPASDVSAGHEFIGWIDGTVVVASATPLGGLPRVQMHWR